MRAICFKIDKAFKKDKSFLKHCISLLANAGNLNDIFDILRELFTILVSKKNNFCAKAKNMLEEKAGKIECFKIDALQANSAKQNVDDESVDSNKPRFPQTEETYLQQSKRSIYQSYPSIS